MLQNLSKILPPGFLNCRTFAMKISFRKQKAIKFRKRPRYDPVLFIDCLE